MGNSFSTPKHFSPTAALVVSDLCVHSLRARFEGLPPPYGYELLCHVDHSDGLDYGEVYIHQCTKKIVFIYMGTSADEIISRNENVEQDLDGLISWHQAMRARCEYYVTSMIRSLRDDGFVENFHSYHLSFGGSGRGGILALYGATDFDLHLRHGQELHYECILCIGAPKIPPPFHGISPDYCVWVRRRGDRLSRLGTDFDFVTYGHVILLDRSTTGTSSLIDDVTDMKALINKLKA